MSYGTLSVFLDIHVVIDLCLVMEICYKENFNENPNNKKDKNYRIQSLITFTQFIIINIPSGDVRLCEGI